MARMSRTTRDDWKTRIKALHAGGVFGNGVWRIISAEGYPNSHPSFVALENECEAENPENDREVQSDLVVANMYLLEVEPDDQPPAESITEAMARAYAAGKLNAVHETVLGPTLVLADE